MFHRNCLSALLVAGVALAFSGCTSGNTAVSSITVSPTSQSVAVGQTAQFTASGTVDHGTHPPTTQDETSAVTWSSSAPAIATVNSEGLATAVSTGTATITATVPGGGVTPATGTITVTGSGGTGATVGGDVTSITVIPGTQAVASAGDTTQFFAIGTSSTGQTENLNGLVAWSSSSTNIVTINSATGFATGAAPGTATITAIFTNPDKTVADGTATFTVQGPIAEEVTALAITPNQQSLSDSGQTGQFIALGTSGTSGLQLNVTSATGISWTSTVPSVASVSATGLVRGVSPGQSTITAIFTNPDGTAASASGVVNITSSPAPEPLLSLIIIPSSITVGNLQDTGNFLAIGTYSTSPNVRDLTNSVTWISSFPDVFPVNSNLSATDPGAPGGVVTAYGNGTATIIAEATDPTTGSIQTATATFSCPLVLPNPPTVAGSCFEGSQAPGLKVTLTIYNEGLNTTNWLITAPSATGTQDVIHCGPGWTGTGGSVCVAAYPLGTTVTLTAPAQAGVNFGGWSWTCTPVVPINATGPNSCTVTLGDVNSTDPTQTSNVTVGAIFN
jgi:uncharacterized protein YjdB